MECLLEKCQCYAIACLRACCSKSVGSAERAATGGALHTTSTWMAYVVHAACLCLWVLYVYGGCQLLRFVAVERSCLLLQG
jgi:hypothetical protein